MLDIDYISLLTAPGGVLFNDKIIAKYKWRWVWVKNGMLNPMKLLKKGKI